MSLKNITKLILSLAVVTGQLLVPSKASANQDPAGCSASGVGISLEIFRDAGATDPILGGQTVQSNQQIYYRSTLTALGGNNCNFSDGTLTITTPDAVVVDVTPGGGIPLVSVGSPFVSALVPYTVSEADVNGANNIVAATNYTNGVSHTGDSHDSATGSVTRNTPYQDVTVEVEKTADPAFDRECTWDIDKTVDVAQHDLTTGESGTSNYDVTVSSDCADTNYSVEGTITVHNPALFADAVITGLADSVNGTDAAVDCTGDPEFAGFPHTLPPGETLTCTYSTSLPDGTTKTNTASAKTSGDVGGGSGTAPVDFTGVTPTTTINGLINVTDTFAGALGSCNEADAPCLFEYDRTFTCDADAGQHDNTATIVETGQSDSASVVVTCTPVVGCTLTQGFWKTHSQAGPAPYDVGWALLGDFDGDGTPEEEGENLPSSTQTWLQVFNTPVKGRVWYQLAHQWMAAYLNSLNGATPPANVATALSDAQTWLAANSPETKKNSAAQTWASLLGSYNEGKIGPGHCTN